MTKDRKAELAQMCAVQIRQASAISKSRLADYGYHLVEPAVDAEIMAMMDRLTDKFVRSGDIELLRDLVIADLWPRLRKAHGQQRENAFRGFPLNAEFSFDIGWADIVQDAVARIETYPKAWRARLVGGKEKLGCLVLHIDYDGSQSGARSEIERLREEVRLRSLATCDICGESGRLRISSIAKTTCDKHAAVLGEFRNDDGVWADPWRWHETEDGDPPPPSAIAENIAADIKQLSGRERELLNRFLLEIEETVLGCAARGADIDEYVRDEIEKSIIGDLDPSPVTGDGKAWLHGYVREAIREEHEGQVSGKTDRGA